MHITAIPIDSGRWLGQPGGRGTMSGSRALGLLLEGDVEKLPCLMQLLVGLWVRRVGDILQPADGDRRVVDRLREA